MSDDTDYSAQGGGSARKKKEKRRGRVIRRGYQRGSPFPLDRDLKLTSDQRKMIKESEGIRHSDSGDSHGDRPEVGHSTDIDEESATDHERSGQNETTEDY